MKRESLEKISQTLAKTSRVYHQLGKTLPGDKTKRMFLEIRNLLTGETTISSFREVRPLLVRVTSEGNAHNYRIGSLAIMFNDDMGIRENMENGNHITPNLYHVLKENEITPELLGEFFEPLEKKAKGDVSHYLTTFLGSILDAEEIIDFLKVTP